MRTGQTMRPTARALALAPRIRDTLHQVQATLRQQAHFDPGTQERTSRLGFSSGLEVLVLPALTARLRPRVPGIRLLGQRTERAAVHELLDGGEQLIVAVAASDFLAVLSPASRAPVLATLPTHMPGWATC